MEILRYRLVKQMLLGVQYACKDYTELLKSLLINQSMSRNGNCWDNAVAGSLFKSLKKDYV